MRDRLLLQGADVPAVKREWIVPLAGHGDLVIRLAGGRLGIDALFVPIGAETRSDGGIAELQYAITHLTPVEAAQALIALQACAVEAGAEVARAASSRRKK